MATSSHILIKHNLNFSNLNEFCIEFEKVYGEKIFVSEFTEHYKYLPPIPDDYKEWRYTIILDEGETIEAGYNQVYFNIFHIGKGLEIIVGKRYIEIGGQCNLLDSWHHVEDLIHIATNNYTYSEYAKKEVISERKTIFDFVKFYKSDECIFFAELEHGILYDLLMEAGLDFLDAIKLINSKYFLINYQDLLQNQNQQDYIWDKVIIFDNFEDLEEVMKQRLI